MTSGDHRPPLQRKHTRTSEASRESALNTGVSLTVEGIKYEARLGDVTPDIARTLRRNTGMGFQGLMSALAYDPDVDLISAFVWVARRIAGDYVDFEDVNVTYRQMLADGFDIEQVSDAEAEVGDDSPES